jgi:hypothetical protein
MSRNRAALAARIQWIKQQIVQLDEIRAGTVTRQYNVCGYARCRCKADPPQKHGPYYRYRSSHGGKDRTEFVSSAEAPRIKRQVRNYALLRKLVNEWMELSLEIVKLDRTG